MAVGVPEWLNEYPMVSLREIKPGNYVCSALCGYAGLVISVRTIVEKNNVINELLMIDTTGVFVTIPVLHGRVKFRVLA